MMPAASAQQRGRANVLAKLNVRTPGIADQQDAEQLVVLSGERDGIDSFIVGRVGGPMHQRRGLLPLLLNLLDNRRNPICLLHGARSVDQELRRKATSQILIKHGSHAGWKFQAGEEIFIDPPASDHEKRFSPTFTSRTANSPSAAPSGSSSCFKNASFGRWGKRG